jgi:hypothetical protein|tara:strand:+ start:5646 stop:5837 length:192 start_codon:yes stop_codon:yes gene_type:complete
MKKSNKTIVRVTETEFELDDGSVFPHFEEIDEAPTVEEFQAIYDYWSRVLSESRQACKSGDSG